MACPSVFRCRNRSNRCSTSARPRLLVGSSSTSTRQPTAMARVAQRAENEWVGVNCGIMDQLISASGVAGHALLIDCRSLDERPVPVPDAAAVVVLDTGTRRGLVDSAYNERRAQCEQVARHFGVAALRDIDLGTFEARAKELRERVNSHPQGDPATNKICVLDRRCPSRCLKTALSKTRSCKPDSNQKSWPRAGHQNLRK